MTTSKIRLSNDFHGSEVVARAKVICESGQLIICELSARQVKHVQQKLCGVSGCSCSGDLGTRGRQYYNECDVHQDGSATLYYNRDLVQ